MMPATMTSAGSAVEFERHREALDHVGAVAGDRSLRDRHHRTFSRAGVIFGDDDDEAGDREANQPANEQTRATDRLARDGSNLAPADNIGGRDREADNGQDAGDDEAPVERAHDGIVGAELDEERADDRGHDAGGADRERVHHRRNERRRVIEEDRGEHHRRDDRHRVSLEQVGGHAGAIADVVADIVGDGGGIAGIVLGNAGLDLADEVGAHVRALGENAAPESGEDRDQRSAETERDQSINRLPVRGAMAKKPRENAKIAGDAQKREASHEQAGHRARAEGDVETAGERFRRRLRGADVGAHRDVHADEAGCARQDGADGEADRHRPRKQEPKNDEHDDADGGDGHVLALQIGLRPFRHRAGNFLHARAAGIGRHQAVDRVDAVDDGKEPTDDYQAQQHARKPHCKAAGFSPRPVSGRLLPETAPRRNAMTAFCARFCDQSRAAAGPWRGSYTGRGRSGLPFRRPDLVADPQRVNLQASFGREQVGAHRDPAVPLLHPQ